MAHRDRDQGSIHELIDELDEAFLRLGAIQGAITSLVSRLDEVEAWRTDGAASMAQWLAARYATSRRSAGQLARLAEQLTELPLLEGALRDRRLSWDQVVAVARVATPQDEQDLVRDAAVSTPEQLSRRASRTTEERTARAHDDRYLRYWWGGDETVLHLRGRLPGADAAVVARALDLYAVDRLPDHRLPDEHYGMYADYSSRCADALVRIASEALGDERDADRATVVVHTSLRDLTSPGGPGEIDDGPAVAHSTLLRLTCDSRIQAVVDDADGITIGIGRTSRTIPPWLGRQIKARDAGCRFPGCARTRWVHRHHIVHWAAGGPTDLQNLLTLCGFHHRLLHEEGWSVRGDPDGRIQWVRPDGSPFRPRAFDPVQIERRVAASRAGRWLPPPIRGSSLDDTS